MPSRHWNRALEHRELPSLERAGALHPQVGFLRRSPGVPAYPFEQLELLAGPAPAVSRDQPFLEQVAQCRQEPGIVRGILQHSGLEWTDRPVRALEALVQFHAGVFLEQRCEADAGFIEQLRGDPGVEKIGCVEPVITIQNAQVVIGVVKNDLDSLIPQQSSEPAQIVNRERVEHRRLTSGGQLDQIDPVPISVKACRLGVDGDQGLLLEPLHQGIECRPGQDVVDGWGQAGVTHDQECSSWSTPGERLPTANRRVKIGRIISNLQSENGL